jgi:predicted ATP-binding protein involved in virulence
MLEMLHLKNVGPAPEMKLEFAPRLNVITGDNGLGKSFILDCAWRMLTARESVKIFPSNIKAEARIEAVLSFTERIQPKKHYAAVETFFERRKQNWDFTTTLEHFEHSLIIYQNVENRFLIREPFRSQLFLNERLIEKKDFFEFDAQTVWDGDSNVKPIINGFIRDVAQWQLQKNAEYELLNEVLTALSSNPDEKLELGQLWQFDLSDSREIPTIKTPVGTEVPVTQVSSAIRRILMLAYILVWSRREHLRAAKALNTAQTQEIILLVDEIDQHLHPQWQRVITNALMQSIEKVMSIKSQVQIITTTHSPLVMASLEPFFDSKKDAWFDLNLVDGQVTLEKMNFVKRGGAEIWLLSDAFDLHSTGSKQREQAIEEAARAIENPKLSKKKFLELDKKLRTLLSNTDKYWVRWRYIGEKKGWL